MEFTRPLPLTDLIGRLGERSPITAVIASKEWRDVPPGLRNRAFWISGVEAARVLQGGRNFIDEYLRGAIDPATGQLLTGSRAQFVSKMRAWMAENGMELSGQNAGLRDPTSFRRLELVFDVQTKQLHDYGAWREGMDPDVLDEFPAQRFIRVREVRFPRDYHDEALGEVRLKTDLDFWIGLNHDFELPYGPWGFNSGCDVETVDRAEAEQLGLIKPGETIKPAVQGLNDYLEASTKGLDDDLIDFLKTFFEDQISIVGSVAKWNPKPNEQPPGDDSGNA